MKTKIYSLLLIFLFSVNIYGQKLSKKQLAKMEHDAHAYYTAAEYEESIKLYEELKSKYPEEVKYDYWIGLNYMRSIHDEKSLPYLVKAKKAGYVTKEKPTLVYDIDYEEWLSEDIDFNLARAYHINREFTKARISYNVALDKMVHVYHGHHHEKEMNALRRYIEMCNNGRKLILDTVNVKIENLGASINSEFRETSPVISADEKTIIFTTRRPGTTGDRLDADGFYTEDIYISHKSNGAWGKPEPIHNVNTSEHESSVAISPNGNKLILYKNNHHLTGDLYISEHQGENWSTPKQLPVTTKHFEKNASISADENMMVFSSDRPGGLGGMDIYVCYREDDHWSEPVNAGEGINTPYNDDAPFIHSAGHTMYFSSKGHNSMGGYDIFKVEFNPQTRKFGNPVNMGYPINTAEDDIFFVFSPDGKRAYFSSHHKDSYGDQDLYMMTMKDAHVPVILLYGYITSKENHTPIHARVKVTDNETGKLVGIYESNSHTGKYTVVLPPGHDYGIVVEADHYLSETKNVSLPDKNVYYEEEVDFQLKNLNKGSIAVLNNVFFQNNKNHLERKSFNELDHYVELLKKNEDLFIEIAGHTELGGRTDYNKKLSQGRAEAVKAYFIQKGIDEKRLHAVGYGDHYPVTLMKTDSEKKKNRRVELIIHDAKVEGKKWEPYYSDKLSQSQAAPATEPDKKK